MNMKKPTLVMKETAGEQPTNNGTTRPKNPPANLRPTEGYILEVDGKFKSERELSSGDESGLGTKEEVSTHPDQSIRRKRANSDASRII
jgi:hypothetical protein